MCEETSILFSRMDLLGFVATVFLFLPVALAVFLLVLGVSGIIRARKSLTSNELRLKVLEGGRK